jgi:hypothetical protein
VENVDIAREIGVFFVRITPDKTERVVVEILTEAGSKTVTVRSAECVRNMTHNVLEVKLKARHIDQELPTVKRTLQFCVPCTNFVVTPGDKLAIPVLWSGADLCEIRVRPNADYEWCLLDDKKLDYLVCEKISKEDYWAFCVMPSETLRDGHLDYAYLINPVLVIENELASPISFQVWKIYFFVKLCRLFLLQIIRRKVRK